MSHGVPIETLHAPKTSRSVAAPFMCSVSMYRWLFVYRLSYPHQAETSAYIKQNLGKRRKSIHGEKNMKKKLAEKHGEFKGLTGLIMHGFDIQYGIWCA